MMHRLYRILAWEDTATATLAMTLYVFMTLAFVVLGVLVVRPDAEAMGPVRLALFIVLLTVHIVLHWFSLRLTQGGSNGRRGQIVYCATQAGLVFAISLLVPQQTIILALYVTLLAETAALLWPEWRAMTVSAGFYIGLLVLNTILVWGFPALVGSLPTTALLFGGVLLYALVLVREGRTRADAQALVRQLEVAQSQLQEYADQVEELTISQERQRMAREMHDTLAQGLAGVILQLEAADSHLEKNRMAEARSVVKQAMHRARQTLHEARRAIQALRSASLEQKDLAGALASEVSEFEATWGVPADLQAEGKLEPIPPDLAQHVLRIVQEGLNNAGRHAQARHVQVRLVQEDHGLRVTVQDDGKGFDVEAAMRRPECFGLQGMDERARRIGGDLRVESTPGRGTCLTLNLEGVPEPGAVSDRAWSSGAVRPGEEEKPR